MPPEAVVAHAVEAPVEHKSVIVSPCGSGFCHTQPLSATGSCAAAADSVTVAPAAGRTAAVAAPAAVKANSSAVKATSRMVKPTTAR